MRSAQQQSDRRPPTNTTRTPNNYNYMNGTQRGPQPVPSNGYVQSLFLMFNTCEHTFFDLIELAVMKKND